MYVCTYIYQDLSARIPVAQPDLIDLDASGGRFESHVIYSSSSYHDIIIASRMFVSFAKTNGYLAEIFVGQRFGERRAACKVCHASWKLRFFSRYTYCLDREATAILVNSGREMFRAAKLLPSGNAKYRLLAKKLERIGKENKKRYRTIAEIFRI